MPIGTEQIAELADYQQNHEQGCDENDVRRSMHVVQQAIDFVHMFLLGWGETGSIVEWFGQN